MEEIQWLDNSKTSGSKFVTLASAKSSNRIYISSALADEWGDREYIKVGIDKKEKRMYIRPTTEGDSYSVKVSNGARNNRAKLILFKRAVMEVFDFLDLDKESRRFEAFVDGDDIVVNLKEFKQEG